MQLSMGGSSGGGGSSSMKLVALAAAAAAAGALYFKSKNDRYPTMDDVQAWLDDLWSQVKGDSTDSSGSGTDTQREVGAQMRARMLRNRRAVAAESMNGGASSSMFVTSGPTGHPTAIGQRQLPGDALIGSVNISGQSLGNKPIFKPAASAGKRPHKYTGIGGASSTLAPPIFGESGWVDMAIAGEVTKNVSFDMRGDPPRASSSFEPPMGASEPAFGPAVDVIRPARNVVNDRSGAPSLSSALTRFE